jgi:inner membrane protein
MRRRGALGLHPARAPLPALAAGGAACVALDAAVDRFGVPPVPVLAAADWTAHLVTAALALRALGREPTSRFAASALVASVAIDVDHVPLTAAMVRGDDPPRPRPHTFVTPAALAALGVIARGRTRTTLLGAAFGVAAHLTRDLFNGPGVAVAWPLAGHRVRLPVPAEAITLAVLAGAAAVFDQRLARP